MGYKKRFERDVGFQTTQQLRDIFRLYLSELEAAGLTQTTDTGQMNIDAITLPTVTTAPTLYNAGYTIHRLWNNVVIRFDWGYSYHWTSSTHIGGATTLKSKTGFSTDGAGNIIGNSVESLGFHSITGTLQVWSQQWVTEDINNQNVNPPASYNKFISFIYKSENTFWMALDFNKANTAVATNGSIPTHFIMINRSTDSHLVSDERRIHVWYSESVGTTNMPVPSYTSYVQVHIKSISTSENNSLNEKLNSPVLASSAVDDKFGIRLRRNYNPLLGDRVDCNYDVVTLRQEFFNNLQEFQIINGSTQKRTFICFKAIGNSSCPMKVSTVVGEYFGLVWD